MASSTAPDGVDMTTSYLGLRLRHPYMVGASPMSAHVDGIRRLVDAGAAAVVLHSLFEEQITEAGSGRIHGIDREDDPLRSLKVAPFPKLSEYPFEPDEHLEHLRKVKAAVDVPVIASLNGTGSGAWLHYAKLMEEAGADALEVNFYEVVTDLKTPAQSVEGSIVRAVQDLKGSLKIPVSVKLAPFFSAFGHMASRLDQAGVDGLVLFNRFYQPDINVNNLTVHPMLHLSHSDELLLRLRWMAILSGRVRPSLALTGGVEVWSDGVKAILAGAHVVQMVSAILRQGPPYLSDMVSRTRAWMVQHRIPSIEAMRGRVSLVNSPDARNFERANYIHSLHQWES